MMNKTNLYAVSLLRALTATLEVEASTEKEAIDKALEIVHSGKALDWEDDGDGVDIVSASLIHTTNPDAAKIEAMLNVLQDNGFEVSEQYHIYGRTREHVGYLIVGHTPNTEMAMSHTVNCMKYAEGLTAENFFTEWKKDVTAFDPAWEVAETIADLDTADAAKCLRDMLEDCDAYAYHLRAVTVRMQKAMLEFGKKEET